MRCWPSSLLLLAACASPTAWHLRDAAAPARLAPVAGGRLAVIPHIGVRLNAKLPPTLEFADGSAQPLADGTVTADSAYFAYGTSGPRPAHRPVRLRLSWCSVGEALCRSKSFPLAGVS